MIVSLSNVFNPDKTPNMIDWLGRAWAVPTNQSNSNSKAKSSTVRSGPVQPSLIQTSQSVCLRRNLGTPRFLPHKFMAQAIHSEFVCL